MYDGHLGLVPEILRLKEEKRALILAHNYQLPEIQDVADFVGDSLELSLQAERSSSPLIVFCGVHFMAEVAAILSRKRVLMPVPEAGCPLAAMATPDALTLARVEHPRAAVVTYINSSVELKASSEWICTSANALRVVEAVPEEEILFLPDQGLGSWVAEQTRKKVWLWPGFCPTHFRLLPADIHKARRDHPQAKILVHPECRPEVRQLADEVLGTGGMLRYARTDVSLEYVIGTEEGLLHRLRKENPGKRFHLASPLLVCPNMKMTDLAALHHSLTEESGEVFVPRQWEEGARRALERMLAVA
jgi:quinolinate synthase